MFSSMKVHYLDSVKFEGFFHPLMDESYRWYSSDTCHNTQKQQKIILNDGRFPVSKSKLYCFEVVDRNTPK